MKRFGIIQGGGGLKALIAAIFCIFPLHAYADGRAASDTSITERFSLYYVFDSVDISEDYLDNKAQIARIRHYLRNSPRIDSITIYSWASPEGGFAHNQWLANERGKTARRFLLSNSPDSLKLNASKIHLSPLAENWPGLLEMVEEKYHRHDRAKVISILKAEGIGNETRKWRLQQLDGGYTWKYLVRRYMPDLRTATWICVWEKVAAIEPIADGPVAESGRMAVRSMKEQSSLEYSYPERPVVRIPVAAVRTNLLVPGLNVGVEVPVGNSWSVGADWYYPWGFRNPDHKNCFQLLGGSLEGRYWFGSDRTQMDRLAGHSVGMNLGAGYYDFGRNYSGRQGEFATVGVDYLYSLPVCDGKLHMEFTVGLGYIYSKLRPYDVFETGGKAFKRGYSENFHWVGPTRAAVSLVVPIKAKRRTDR